MQFLSRLPAIVLVLLTVAGLEPRLLAQAFQTESFQGQDVVAGEILVRFRDGMNLQAQTVTAQDADIYSAETAARGTMRLRSRGRNVATLLQAYRNRFDVLYAEPNYVVHADDLPNDTLFAQQWGLRNTGQSIVGVAGTSGADIGAVQAWDITEGSRSIVVGVVDTGVDYNHPDLAANVWSAPAQFTVNIGGQLITCAAGTHGFNAITRTCNPMDDVGHGTHVSGILAGTGNNGGGVSGVSRVGSIMGLKFLSATGGGTVWDVIAAIDFAIQVKALFPTTANVRILNNSWGGSNNSTALRDEISLSLAADMLFVASAGNTGTLNELVPHFPSNFDLPHILAVAATDNRNGLASFSNWGGTTVHLGAPGVNVMSSLLAGTYDFESGTSMATPMVSGAAALVLSACTLTTAQLRANLIGNVDALPALAGKTTSGGRLNVYRALTACAGSTQPGFRLSVTPGSQNTEVNGTVNLTATVAPVGGFAGTVILTASGLPSGISAALNPTSIAGASGTATLTLTTGAAVPAGKYSITVTGTSGALTSTSIVELTVGASISPGQMISGTLTTSDQASSQSTASHADIYRFTLASSTTVRIDATSRVFDTYLYVLSSSGAVVGLDDDSGADFDAAITLTLQAGTYSIEVTSSDETAIGPYTLSVNMPTLSTISPPMGKPGSAVLVTLSGNRLTGPLSISAGAGIVVTNIASTVSTQAQAVFTVLADAVPGLRQVTLTTAEGISNTATFEVPEVIGSNQRITGTLSTTDQIASNSSFRYADMYRLEVTSTATVTVDLLSSEFSTYLTVHSTSNAILNTALGTGSQSHARISTSLNAGTYYLRVSSTANRAVGNYSLSVDMPAITAISPRFRGANASATVTLTGSNFIAPMTIDAGAGITVSNINVASATSTSATFSIASGATPGLRSVVATTAAGNSNAASFRVYSEIPSITANQTVNGVLATTDDRSVELPTSYQDFYQLTLPATELVTMNLSSTAFDAYLLLISSSGTVLTSNDNSGGNGNSRITASLTAGTYFLEVASVNRDAVGAYALSVSELVLTTISPRFGSSTAPANVTLTGQAFTAPLTIDAGPGITVSNVNVASLTSATATLTIASGASVGVRNLTVSTVAGTSNPVTFTVLDTTPSITMGQTVTGTLAMTDSTAPGNTSVYADMYRLTLTSSTLVGVTLSSSSFDSYVQILSETGTLLTSNNDSAGQTTARASTTLGAGTYYILATSWVSGLGDYTLSVGTPPTLTSITPDAAGRGRVVGIRLTGTGFAAPLTVDAGTGITVANVDVLSSTSTIATFTTATNATLGFRDVRVTNAYGTATVSFNVQGFGGGSTLRFPRLFSPADLAGTGFAIVNPSDSLAFIDITLHGPDGSVVASVSNERVPARGQYARLGNEIFPTASEAGWIRVSSSTTGLQSFWVGGNFSSYMDGAEAAPRAREIVFPLVTSQTEISLANAGSGANTVTFRIYGAAGTELATAVTQNLALNGIYTTNAASLFPAVNLQANVVSIRASGTDDVAGTTVTTDFPVAPSWAVVNGVDTSLSLFEVNVAHVPTGPDAGWISVLGVTNLSTSSQNVVITFTPVSGSPAQTTRTIAGGATLRDSVHTLFGFSGAYREGWLKVSGTAALSGFLAYGFTGTNGSAVVPGLGIPQTALIFSHVAMGPGWGTGLALLNATSTPANVQVYIMRKDGTLVGGADNVPTAAFTLAPNTKVARLLEELVPASNANDGFVYVRTTNNVPLYGLEVFFTRDVQVMANVAAGIIDSSITYTPPAP